MGEHRIQAPKPGSREARDGGCVCPVIDNHHGAGMPYPGGPRWVVRGDCPMHGDELAEEAPDAGQGGSHG